MSSASTITTMFTYDFVIRAFAASGIVAVVAIGVGMVLGVLFQLLLLAAFKYLGFLIHSLDALGLRIGLQIDDVPALPVGISFFTFHAISYLVDCYRGNTRVERSLFRLANYLLLFPHLLAGPIVLPAVVTMSIALRLKVLAFSNRDLTAWARSALLRYERRRQVAALQREAQRAAQAAQPVNPPQHGE